MISKVEIAKLNNHNSYKLNYLCSNTVLPIQSLGSLMTYTGCQLLSNLFKKLNEVTNCICTNYDNDGYKLTTPMKLNLNKKKIS